MPEMKHIQGFTEKWKAPNEPCLVNYHPKTQREFFYLRYWEFIRSFPGKEVLDIGCGRGTIGLYATLEGRNATLIDAVPESIELAKENFKKFKKKGKFRVGDVRNLPFGRNKFDLTVSIGVSEHLDSGLGGFFREQYKVLKKDGVMVSLNLPDKLSIQTFFQINHDFHRENVSEEEYIEYAKMAGFKQVYILYVNPFPLVWTTAQWQESILTKIYKLIYLGRAFFMKYPFKANKYVAQGHFLVAVK